MSALVKQLVEAGVHYGHRVSRWNPKMRPYIYARRNLIHIIDIRETIRGLLRAKNYLKQVAERDSLILFVGRRRSNHSIMTSLQITESAGLQRLCFLCLFLRKKGPSAEWTHLWCNSTLEKS